MLTGVSEPLGCGEASGDADVSGEAETSGEAAGATLVGAGGAGAVLCDAEGGRVAGTVLAAGEGLIEVAASPSITIPAEVTGASCETAAGGFSPPGTVWPTEGWAEGSI